MFDFNAGARRPADDDARAKRLAAAQDLVRRTLAQNGITSLPAGAAPRSSTPHRARGLGDLLKNVLGPGQMPLRQDVPVPLEIPDGAQFLSATYQGSSGSRAYRTYVPASAGDGASGIVMMLHGCTQTPEDFAVGTGMNAHAERHGFIVIYPEQSRGANAQTCWNWFSPSDQRRGRGEPDILAGIATAALERYGVAPDRTFVAGFSAGAAMAVVLGETHPDVFAAVGAHSGLPYGAAHDVTSAFSAMAGQSQLSQVGAAGSNGVRTIVFHGDADATVNLRNGEAIARNAEHLGPQQSIHTVRKGKAASRSFEVRTGAGPCGPGYVEHWTVEGMGHAWSGGQPRGSYTEPGGPDASAEMVRFFFETGE